MAAYKFMIIQILLHHQALNYVTILTVFPITPEELQN